MDDRRADHALHQAVDLLDAAQRQDEARRILAAFTADGIQADQTADLHPLDLKSDFHIGQRLLGAARLLHHLGQIDILAQRAADHRFRLEVQQLRGLGIEVRDDAAARRRPPARR